jgi:hypothetical protein
MKFIMDISFYPAGDRLVLKIRSSIITTDVIGAQAKLSIEIPES